MAEGDRGEPGTGERHAGQLQRAHRPVLVAGYAVDAFQEIEDQVMALDPGEPAKVVQMDGKEGGTMTTGAETGLNLVHIGHDCRDVGLAPLTRAAIVDDRNLHAAAALRSRRPEIRRHAISATAWISCSYVIPAARAAIGTQELSRGSG